MVIKISKLCAILFIILTLIACSKSNEKVNTNPNKSTVVRNIGDNLNKLELENKSKSNFLNITMFDKDTGWALCQDKILHTNNGGLEWKNVSPKLSSIQNNYLYNYAYFINSNIGYVTIDYGDNKYTKNITIFKTANGGNDWSEYSIEDHGDVKQLYFINEDIGWLLLHVDSHLAHEDIAIYNTENGGKSWSKIAYVSTEFSQSGIDDSGIKNGLTFLDKSIGYLTGSFGYEYNHNFYKTTDSGKTWTTLKINRNAGSINYDTIYPPTFFDRNNGVIFTHLQDNTYIIFNTDNAGLTWKEVSKFKSNNNIFYSFINKNVGWLIDGTKISKTTDGGNTFIILNKNINFGKINQVTFIDNNTGWILCNGLLLRTNDSGKTWINVDYSIK